MTFNNMNNLDFDIPKHKSSVIKVVGVGGGGSNAVNQMYSDGITGVDFVVCNTDAQALIASPVVNKIQLGLSLTEGMGAGANPEVGERAAKESKEDITKLFEKNTKMIFITAGMGGGTGTGAAPVIAQVAKEMNILTVAIVTTPFKFEGAKRHKQADKGIQELKKHVDSLIIVNNNKLREVYGNFGAKAGFAKADEVLAIAAKGIAEVITENFTVNIDLEDARTVLANSGTALMGSAKASGENRAKEVILKALDSPLLDSNRIVGAKNVLLLIISGKNEITMDEIADINEYVQSEAGSEAEIIFGLGEDLDMEEDVSVTVIATGFENAPNRVEFDKPARTVIHTLEEDQPISETFDLDEVTDLEAKIDVDDLLSDIAKNQSLDEPLEDSQMDFDELAHKKNQLEFNFESRLDKREILEEPRKESSTEDKIQNEVKEDKSIVFHSLEMEEEKPLTLNFEEKEDFVINNDKVSKEKNDSKTIDLDKTPTPKQTNPSSDPLEEPFEFTLAKNNVESKRLGHLKSYSYSFENPNIEEIENTPAYKRQGIELDNPISDTVKKSETIISGDKEEGIKLNKINPYLHGNVD